MSTGWSIGGLIDGRAQTAPERMAYGSGRDGRFLTYGCLARQVTAWSRLLTEHDIGPGHRAGLAISDPLAFAVAYLSFLESKVTVAPLNPQAPSEEVARLAGMLGLDLLITDRDDLSTSAGLVWRLGDGYLPAPEGGYAPRPSARRLVRPPAVLLSSSGSTGEPKVVPLGERQLLYVARKIAAHHRLGPSDRGYSALPLFHVNAQVVGLLATLAAGSGLVMDQRFHRRDFWSVLDSWQVTWLNAVPAILAILNDIPAPASSTAARLRFTRTASAPLAAAVRARFEDRSGVSVLETYGMTEAASQITANPLELAARPAGSAGLPVGVRLRVVDRDRRPCLPGEVGSVEISGPSVVHHYLVPGRDERLRSARTADGWLVTGDIGYQDEGGYLFLTGREDDVINSGGEKIYPREVEEVLRAHPGVTEAVVVGQLDGVLGQAPVAYITGRDGEDPAGLAAQLVALCESRLSKPKRPRRLVVADTLPVGPTGKISRRRLQRDAFASGGRALAEWGRAS